MTLVLLEPRKNYLDSGNQIRLSFIPLVGIPVIFIECKECFNEEGSNTDMVFVSVEWLQTNEFKDKPSEKKIFVFIKTYYFLSVMRYFLLSKCKY